MSYTQFSYTYPTSSQLLMTGNHPATATPCCQPASPVEPYASGGAPQPTPAAAVCSLPAAYDSRLLSSFPRLAGLYATSAASATYADPQGYVTAALAGTNPSAAFYSTLTNPYELKDSRGTWAPLSQGTATACYPYDPTAVVAYGPYGDRYSSMDSVARRKNATRETTNTLKAWLYEHRKNPYPTKGEKIMLAIITKMTLTQVSTWFANARRRLKKENKMTWEPRNKSGDGGDGDDKDDNASSPSPPPSDNGTKKSDDDTLHECQDEDSEDMHVKTEMSNNAPDDRTNSSEYEPCSVKSETALGSTGCVSVGLAHYGLPHPPTLTACSPSSEFRSHSPLSPEQRLPILAPEPIHHHHHHHHHLQYEENQQHLRSGYPVPHVNQNILRQESPSAVLCDGSDDLIDDRPKIWSLAHTATSDSPPNLKRLPEDYVMACGSPKSSPTGASRATTGFSCGGRVPTHRPPEDNGISRRWLNGENATQRTDCAREGIAPCDEGKGPFTYSMRRYPESSRTVMDCYNSGISQPIFDSCLSPPNCNSAFKPNDNYLNSCGDIPSTSSSSSSSPAGSYMQRNHLQRKPINYVNDDQPAISLGEFESCDRQGTQGKSVQQDKSELIQSETVNIPVQSCMTVMR